MKDKIDKCKTTVGQYLDQIHEFIDSHPRTVRVGNTAINLLLRWIPVNPVWPIYRLK